MFCCCDVLLNEFISVRFTTEEFVFVVLSADGFERSVTDSSVIVSQHLLHVTINNVRL